MSPDCPKCGFHPSPVSKALPDISVNIDDWLEQKQTPKEPGPPVIVHPVQVQLPANATPEDRKKARAEQARLRAEWEEREELAEREHLLDNESKECVECSAQRRHYKNDYVCYRCRDEAGGPA